MIFWLDAQLPPQLAPWLAQRFGVEVRALREIGLRDAPYRPLSAEAPEVPQVCIRIPTGGGKTLLAAHAIERAARLSVFAAAPVLLWLVPSNTIRIQTRDALRTPGHPYREALLDYWPADRLAVIDIAECGQLRAQNFGNHGGGKTIIQRIIARRLGRRSGGCLGC